MLIGAEFDQNREYRYTLYRIWNEKKPYAMFIGLNPSTADELEDDPTVRRCISFSKDWNYGGLFMMNAFAFRSTDPKVLEVLGGDPIGPNNDYWLKKIAKDAGIVIAAWGTYGVIRDREKQIIRMFMNQNKLLYCLGYTKEGHPKHPLYLKKDTRVIPFRSLINPL